MTPLIRADVEDFLFAEAALLDDWRLDDWLALWTDDGHYIVPSTDTPDGDPRTTLSLVADDLALLRSRVHQLVTGATWAEVPRSRVQHMIANVRILEQDARGVRVTSNFVVHRFREGRADAFVGTYRHELVRLGDAIRIREKRATLAHASLHAHGSVSILL